MATMQNLANRYLTDRNWTATERLREFAAERGKTLLDLAFSWLLARPQVASVIAGATRPEQLEQNVNAGNWRFSTEELAEIDAITGPAQS